MERCRCAGWVVGLAVMSAGSVGSAARADGMTRHVLIVGVDGMRPDAMVVANAPNFDALIAAGAFTPFCQAEDITISGPGWSSILCGVHRDKHGVTDNSFVGSRYDLYPHFYQRLQSVCDARTVSIVNWTPVNSLICRDNADVAQSPGSDDQVTAAVAAVLAGTDQDVVFLHFDACDAAGHAFGFDPTIPQYLAAIEATDARVGQLMTAIHARPNAAREDWLIIVTSDHGGTIDGAHGRNIPEHRNTGLIVSGLSSAAGTTIPAAELVDVPATVMAFLGVPVDPAWGWDGVPRGLDLAHSPSDPFACAPPPPPRLGACCLGNGRCVQLTEGACLEARGVWSGLDEPCPPGGCEIPTTLLREDFSAVALGPNRDETLAGAAVWSPSPPAGWSVDRSLMPTGGVTEWRGWSVADRPWWTAVAGDQNRSLFTKGVGAVAVADPDEWDDLAHAAGLWDSSLSTPALPLAGIRPGTLRVFMDSSWRPDSGQTAEILARYDGGPPVTVARWTSEPGPQFKPDSENETLCLPLANPAGAGSLVLTFRLSNSANTWWWALDNLEVRGLTDPPRRVLLWEDFEGVPLGPNVDETLAAAHVWSGTPPAGWVFDDSGVPGVNDPAVGVTEWEGWAITDKAWWVTAAVDQERSQFTRGTGAVAVADPDEWDDRGTPSALGPYNARMISRRVPLTGVDPGTATLEFDSSWRYEGLQRAQVRASYSTGQTATILRWESQAGPFFKPDATDEHILIPLGNPAGAAWVDLTFELLDARNNWWWAVDNISVTGRGSPCAADFNGDGFVDFFDYDDFVGGFEAGDPRADVNRDGFLDFFDYDDFVAAFERGC